MKKFVVFLAALVISLGQQAYAIEIDVEGLIGLGYEKLDNEKTMVGEIELNIDARLNENISGNILLGPGLDEVTIDLEVLTLPISISVGKAVMPFGVFNSHLISDPWTQDNKLVEWETNAVGIIGKYVSGMFESACAFYDLSKVASALQFSVIPTNETTFGISYKSYYKDDGEKSLEYGDLSGMATLAVYPIAIDLEYCGATKRKEGSPKPSAYSAGLAFQVIDPLELAIRYDRLKDDDKKNINPESKIGVGFNYIKHINYNLFKVATLSAEYARVKGEEKDKDGDEFLAKLTMEF